MSNGSRKKKEIRPKMNFILKCPRSLNSTISRLVVGVFCVGKCPKVWAGSLQKCRYFLAENLCFLFFFRCSCLPSGLLVQFLETSDKITSYCAANTAIVHLNDVLLTCDCFKMLGMNVQSSTLLRFPGATNIYLEHVDTTSISLSQHFFTPP